MGPLARMQLLGGFALDYLGAPVKVASQRMQSLLAYVALHRAESHSRQRLAFLLWPDSSESQAFTNLRTLLHRLNSIFPEIDQLIEIDPQAIAWRDATSVRLDVADFEDAIRQANSAQSDDDSTVGSALEAAVACYTGDLLPDCYDEWILTERERLRQILCTALERLATLLEQRRSYGAAVEHTRRLMRFDSLNEITALTLMRLHTLNGDRASAIRVYHTYASTLQTEMGIAPGAALNVAYERLLAAEAVPPTVSWSTGMTTSLPLVGRDREWKRMQTAWHVAVSGQPRLLILSGEAGIGKTRLAEAFRVWADRQGILTASTPCYAAEGDLAYAPVTALLRSEALRPGLARLNPEWLSEVARLAPDVLAGKPELLPLAPLAARWQRERLFEALARAVLVAERLLLLVIDDLQWCDQDTLEWLHFLLRHQPPGRLLVLGTVRAEEVDPDHPLVLLRDVLRREARMAEIPLNPLSRDETAELARHLSGHAPSREQADDLYNETEGNPLFVVETLRAAMTVPVTDMALTTNPTAARPGIEASGLPPTVQAVVTRRLSHLSPAAHRFLEVAAVIGRSFTLGVVTRAIDLDEDTVVRGLDELWQRRIVHEQGADAYDFTHGKLCSVAYAQLSAARQRMLHRRVAEALEGEYAANLDPVSGQIAMHYERAGIASQAVAYYSRAAAYARHLFANEVAIAHYWHALALIGEHPTSDRVDLDDQLGEVLHFIGRYDEARDVWRSALDVTPHEERLTRAHLYRKLGNAWRDQYHYEEAQRAYNAAEAALGSLEIGDSEALWLCWGQIGLERMNLFYWLGQATELLHLIDQVQWRFEKHGSMVERVRLHQISAMALLRQSRYDDTPQAIEHAQQYLNMLGELGDTAPLPAAHFQLGFALLWGSSDLAAAEKEILTALTMAQLSGDVSLEARCLTYLTVIARMRGEIDQTRNYAERSLHAAETGGMHEYIGAAQGNLAWLAWRAGDLTAARSHGNQALEAWRRLQAGYMFEWIGRLPLMAMALSESDVDEALIHARVLLDERQKRMPHPVESALEAAVRAADNHDKSYRLLQQATELAQKLNYL